MLVPPVPPRAAPVPEPSARPAGDLCEQQPDGAAVSSSQPPSPHASPEPDTHTNLQTSTKTITKLKFLNIHGQIISNFRAGEVDEADLLLLLESHVLVAVLQGRNHGFLQRFPILQLLLLQSRLDVDLLPHPLLRQLAVQLVNAPVRVSDQRVQIIYAQLSR